MVEFIGGSYLAATPQLSYRRLLETLARRGWRIHAWSYVPGFDHQSQANQAWREFRRARLARPPAAPAGRSDLARAWGDPWQQQPAAGSGRSRDRPAAAPGAAERGDGAAAATAAMAQVPAAPVLRLGHSLGCKLHLLAPDAGRGCAGLVALAFNNFSAERSVPLLAEAGQRFGFRSEFSPSPAETLRQVVDHYHQARNLLVRFQQDGLDQSRRLLASLRQRPDDASLLLELRGDHLTPASAGLRRQLLGDWADDPARQRGIDDLCERIERWWLEPGRA
ncbi:MAG: DUF1350 family protein [Synechococcus sp.]|nr:DUF1350 family protein [Synechococcus sp.]